MEDASAPTNRRLRPLLLGADRGTTRRALVLAGCYAVAPAVLEYLYLPPGGDVKFVGELLGAFVVEPNLTAISSGAYGVFTVVGLAGIAAALNEGLLPSVILAVAPTYGSHVWVIAGAPENPYLAFRPVGAVGWTFPEPVTFAAFGFLLGLGVRRLGGRRGDERGPTTPG